LIFNEDDLLPVSALSHLLFCERRAALIHIEQAWAENLFTAEGRIMHEHVHAEERESRGKIRIEYGMPLRSLRLGLNGASRKRTAATRFSSAPRRFVWRK